MGRSHLDTEALDTLKEVMEDEFQLLIDTFIQDSSERLVNLQGALQRDDAEEVRRLAHSFKGSSGNIGAPHLSELCAQVEASGREAQLAGVASTLAAIETEFAAVKEELAQL